MDELAYRVFEDTGNVTTENISKYVIVGFNCVEERQLFLRTELKRPNHAYSNIMHTTILIVCTSKGYSQGRMWEKG